MKISLIQPRWRIETDSLSDPLSLGYLASYLKSSGYKDIKIHSAVFDSDKKMISYTSNADVVGMTATSSMMPHVNILVDNIKKRTPRTIIVLGGVHPSALPEDVLKNRNIDYVVRGEGEITFYELIEAINSNKDVDNIAGISYRKNNIICHNRNRTLVENIDILPFPDRRLMIQESYIRRYYNVWNKRAVAVLGSRGCYYNCSPCASEVVWSGKWRARSPLNVVEEIEQLVKDYRVNEIHFEDANFALDKQRVIDLCSLLIKRKFKISWNCLIYPNGLDKDTLKVMKYAGCKTIGIGIESGSYQILKEYGKFNVDIKKAKDIFNISKKLNINRIAFVVLGLPSETRITIQQTKDLLLEIQPDYMTCSMLTPFPGTKYYKIAKEKGYINNDFDWSKLYYTRPYMPTNNLTKRELYDEYKKLLKELDYSWRRRALNFWPLYYKLKVEFINSLPREYLFLIYRLFRHVKLLVFNRLYKIINL